MWEKVPFDKGPVARGVLAIVIGGAGLITVAVLLQQKKHGYL